MPAQDLLGGIAGRAVVVDVGVFGCGQGAPVEFAVDGERQRVQHDDRRGHHVVGQRLGQRRTRGSGSTAAVAVSVT